MEYCHCKDSLSCARSTGVCQRPECLPGWQGGSCNKGKCLLAIVLCLQVLQEIYLLLFHDDTASIVHPQVLPDFIIMTHLLPTDRPCFCWNVLEL